MVALRERRAPEPAGRRRRGLRDRRRIARRRRECRPACDRRAATPTSRRARRVDGCSSSGACGPEQSTNKSPATVVAVGEPQRSRCCRSPTHATSAIGARRRARTPSAHACSRRYCNIRRLFEVKAVREARGERVRSPMGRANRPSRAAGAGHANRSPGCCVPAGERFAQQEFVERRAADVGADVAVRMQEAAALALPAQVFAGELVGGAGALHEIRLRDAEQRMHAALRRQRPAADARASPAAGIDHATSSARWRNARSSAAAAIQPTAPPPATTTLRMRCSRAGSRHRGSARPGNTAQEISCAGMRATAVWICSRTRRSARASSGAFERVGARIVAARHHALAEIHREPARLEEQAVLVGDHARARGGTAPSCA